MFRTVMSFNRLALESQQVIMLRMMALGSNSPSARKEATRMVAEKFEAGSEAALQLMMGASPEAVLKGYNKKVSANLKRLRRASRKR